MNHPATLRICLVRSKFQLESFLSKNGTFWNILVGACFSDQYNLNPFMSGVNHVIFHSYPHRLRLLILQFTQESPAVALYI